MGNLSVSAGKKEKPIKQQAETYKQNGLGHIIEILKEDKPIDNLLKIICSLIPKLWQYPEFTAARITFKNQIFTSENFKETQWKQSQLFEVPEKINGIVEIFYLKKFPKAFEGPFLREERDLLNNLSLLISGSISRHVIKMLLHDNTERKKELRGINRTSNILQKDVSLEESLQEICNLLPEAWQIS